MKSIVIIDSANTNIDTGIIKLYLPFFDGEIMAISKRPERYRNLIKDVYQDCDSKHVRPFAKKTWSHEVEDRDKIGKRMNLLVIDNFSEFADNKEIQIFLLQPRCMNLTTILISDTGRNIMVYYQTYIINTDMSRKRLKHIIEYRLHRGISKKLLTDGVKRIVMVDNADYLDNNNEYTLREPIEIGEPTIGHFLGS